MNNTKITTLGILRGIAVLAVCCCHFAKPFEGENILFGLMPFAVSYGNLGVHIFFVISGFIIPYSLSKSKYTINNYFTFLYKRILRLHPPYLIALLFTLMVAGLSYKVRHIANPESFMSICKSLFYLHAPADNPVFWTLKIEAEYYLFIGLFHPILVNKPKVSLFIVMPILLALSQSLAIQYLDLLLYIPFFLIGLVGFLIHKKEKNILFEYAALFLLSMFCFTFYLLAAVVVALLTVTIILFIKKPIHSSFDFVGEISYSVYLIHFLIGVKLLNLTSRHVGNQYHTLLFFLAMFISLAAGWVFWKIIEKPFTNLSGNVKYKIDSLKIPELQLAEAAD